MAQLGSVSVLGIESRRFKSCHPDWGQNVEDGVFPGRFISQAIQWVGGTTHSNHPQPPRGGGMAPPGRKERIRHLLRYSLQFAPLYARGNRPGGGGSWVAPQWYTPLIRRIFHPRPGGGVRQSSDWREMDQVGGGSGPGMAHPGDSRFCKENGGVPPTGGRVGSLSGTRRASTPPLWHPPPPPFPLWGRGRSCFHGHLCCPALLV